MRSHSPIRNRLKWKARYAWDMLQEYRWVQHEPEGREAVVAACVSLLQGRWGLYSSPGVVERQLARVLDALLLLMMQWARAVKRSAHAVRKVAHLLVGDDNRR